MKYNSAILTITDVDNYGNRLQNYALQSLLSRYGTCTTITMPIGIKKKLPYCLIKGRGILSLFIKRIYSYMFNDERSVKFKRFIKCSEMTDSLINHDSFYLSCTHDFFAIHGETFKTLVIGSDQVWNYQWLTSNELELRLGSFAFNEHDVFSYAASFGVSDIDDEAKKVFQKYLPQMKSISVREDRGAEIVKEMTHLNATVVLDPTLMLASDKWMKITEGFVPDDDEYVLTYFLGRPSDEQERDIQAYAKAHGCRVRRILDLRDKETYVAGPQDFVELFSKAQYVFTDSYHACCFSILFHKQFTVFNRAGMTGKSSMNSRMETLFRLFDLDSVMMDSGLAPEIDYVKVDRLLEQHRRESQAWLDMAMEE